MENQKNIKAAELIVGKRYFLDSDCDTSGVYLGIENECLCFNEIQGELYYLSCFLKGFGQCVPFSIDADEFYDVIVS